MGFVQTLLVFFLFVIFLQNFGAIVLIWVIVCYIAALFAAFKF
jgi:hypothetical protein